MYLKIIPIEIKIKEKIMIQDEFQNSDSSKDDDDEELVIKPFQNSKLDPVLHDRDRKKRKHSREHKSCRRHHHTHNYKSGHLKSFNDDSYSKINQNMESEFLHHRDDKGIDQIKESKEDIVDQDITDVRDVRFLKDIRENRRYSSKRNEKKSRLFCDEMKIEWRKKRILWLQHQKKQVDGLQPGKEKNLEDKKPEVEFNEYKSMHTECSKSQNNSSDYIQINDEKYFNSISPVSSGEDSMDYEENKKRDELTDEENEHASDQRDIVAMSDISDDDYDAQSRSDGENVESESANEKEKVVLQEKSPSTEPAGETEAVSVFKKENLSEKSAEENKIIAVSQEKCPNLEPAGIPTPKLPVYCPAIQGCRSIDGFHVLNRIEEGTYGVVYRARDKGTKEIVALKRLKMEREKEGFPITSLREINTLLKAQHPNIVTVREIVVGSHMDRIYIVMDYVEHDLKSLMKIMPRPFLIGEVKTLLLQLLCAVAHLHDNWILHRDLKTSNLLLSHQGILKVGDFGLAREYGSPLKSYTPVVVTLWYRAPELLLAVKKYSTAIDMWSVGCIFSELLTKNPLFPGKSESDQINRIFKILGTPSEKIWPGYSELPLVQSMKITQYPYNNLKSQFSHTFTDVGFDLLNKFLTYNPARRISAEKAKNHEYFNEKPLPVLPNMFPTWPAKSEQKSHKTARSNPKLPVGCIHYSKQ